MSLQALLGLIICNLVWSAHPAMGKLVLEDLSPLHAAWMRYTLAVVSYFLLLAGWRVLAPARVRDGSGRFARILREPFLRPRSWRELGLVVLLGFATFCFSPILQLTGLSASRATDNALIVAMEPLFTILMAALLLRERMRPVQWISLLIALAGFGLLTGIGPGELSSGWDPHLIGNLLMLLSLTGEAAFSVLGRKLTLEHPPASVFGTALVAGVVILTALVFASAGPPPIHHIHWKAWLGLLWLGPMGTMASYLFWMVMLTDAPVATLAITLFVQPVSGSLWGYLFLGERLTPVQVCGSVLILAAVFVQSRRAPVIPPIEPL